MRICVLLLAVPLLLSACSKEKPAAPPPKEPAKPVIPPYGRVERMAFNRAAVRLNLPLYWIADKNANKVVDPDEVATLLFYPTATVWADKGAFTPDFAKAYEEIVKWSAEVPPGDDARVKLVVSDLDQGRSTLVLSDFRGLSDEEKTFLRHMQVVAPLIDKIFTAQVGADVLAARVPADAPSQSLFRRNWGPLCVGPKTQANPNCTAIPGNPPAIYGHYPAALQADRKFCEALEKNPDKELTKPFTVVREKDKKLVAVLATEAYPEMAPIAKELHAAAADVKDPAEAALKAYLEAAAKGFETDAWDDADEAWSKMNAENSKWYLRVGPDEVYTEPCNLKAHFHMTLARINPDSLAWQKKLQPVQQEMEDTVAKLAGAPYKARKVAFHLPDFIDIVWNGGDDRDPLGATIGQSLPNWGPVAAAGRGRTVAMSNLYADPDSAAARRRQAEGVLDAASLGTYAEGGQPGLLSTILHEAMHEIGPAKEYKVKGKTDDEIFGGPLATIMEELKAQTGALYLLDFLRQKGIIDQKLAEQTYLDCVIWAFGHISQGMTNAEGRPKAYSQLAAIQIGFLLEKGAMAYEPTLKTASGETGGFHIDMARFPAVVDEMMKTVIQLKSTGDKKKAEELVGRYVVGGAEIHQKIAERMLREPKASFVYSLSY